MAGKKITTTARDLATASVVVAVALATFVYFDVSEGLQRWLRRYEVLEFDELLISPIVVAVLLGVYYRRERKELRREMAERERVGEILRRSEAGLVAAQRIARIGNFEYSFGEDVAMWSDEVYRIFGFEPRSFVPTYKTFLASVHPDDKGRLREAIRGFLYHERRDDVEYRVVGPDGEARCVHTRCEVVYGEGGEPLELVGTVQDVTERVRTEEALREAKERYRVLVEHVPAAIYVDDVDETNSVIYRSPHAEKILGYTPEEFLSHPEFWQDLLHPDDRGRVLDENERTNETGEPFRIEYRMRRKDGRYVWLRDEAVLVLDEEGRPKFWQGFFSDITERKEAEEGLQEAEARYRTLVEGVPAITYTHVQEPGGPSYTGYISPQVETILGYTPEEYSGDPEFWKTILHPDDRGRIVAEDLRTGETVEAFREEFRMISKDGRVVWLREEGRPVREHDGAQTWHGVMFDITELKQTEGRLREAEAQYRTLVEQIPAVTYVQDVEHGYTAMFVSPQVEALTGYSPEDFYADPDLWYGVTHPDDMERVRAEDERTDETGEPFELEYRVVHRDGRTVWVRDEAVLVEDPATGQTRFWQGVLLDITERKLAEEAVRRSEAGLAEAQRMARLGSWEWDACTGEARWSDETYRIYGREPKEFVPTLEGLMEITHPDDRAMVEEKIDAAMYRGEPYDFYHRIVRPDGAQRIIHRRAEVVFGDGGEPLRMIGTVHDVTERKVLEERLEHQAMHDPLTGLLNRAMFTERLRQALARAGRRTEKTAVLFLDLDNFKYVNDSLGHEAGDGLLVAVAERLAYCVRAGDTLARLGGTSSPCCSKTSRPWTRRSASRRGSSNSCASLSTSRTTSWSSRRASGSP